MKTKNFLRLVLLALMITGCTSRDNSELEVICPVEPPIKETITLANGTVIEKKGNEYFWLGDILLTEDDLQELESNGFVSRANLKDVAGPNMADIPHLNISLDNDRPGIIENAVGVHPYENKTWSMVRYVYAPDLTPDRKSIVQQDLLHIGRQIQM